MSAHRTLRIGLAATAALVFSVAVTPESALGYGGVTHSRIAAETFDRVKPALEARLGLLGDKNGNRTQRRDYFRFRNAFCYGAMAPDAGKVYVQLSDPAKRARLQQVISEFDARRVGGFATSLSTQEISPFPADTHSLDFALHYLLDEAMRLPSPEPRREAVCFCLGWTLHMIMDKFVDTLALPYQVAGTRVGELGLHFPGAPLLLYPLGELEGLSDIIHDLALDPAMIQWGEWAAAIVEIFLVPGGWPPYEVVPVRSDYVVNFDLPSLFRAALQRWASRHGGQVPSALGIRNMFRLFTLGFGLVDGVFFNWSRVLEKRSKMYFGTAEFKICDIVGRRLSLLCEDGQFKLVYDVPGPFNIVKGISADTLKLALRRVIEAYVRGYQVATVLFEHELPSFGFAGLGIAEVRFSLEVSFAEPEFRLKVRLALFGHGPTVYTHHIPLPKEFAQYLIDPQGKIFTLVGLALFPDLNLDPLFPNHLEYQFGRIEGFIAYPRYRAFWAGSQPLGRPDAVSFSEQAALEIAYNLNSGNYSGNLWLDDAYWAYGGLGERACAALQSHIRYARSVGALGPEFAAHPEILLHSILYRRGSSPIREIPDLSPDPIAVEVDLLSPLMVPPSVSRDIVLRVRRSEPWAPLGRGAVIAESVLTVNLQAIGVRERLRNAAGARVRIQTSFAPGPRDAGYIVEVAIRAGATEETLFTSDVGVIRRYAIEDVTFNGANGKRLHADMIYAAFPAWQETGQPPLRGLRFARAAALARPVPVGGEGVNVLYAAESAGFDDMSYAKLRVPGRTERVESRGVVVLVQRASGATELRVFDTHGNSGAEGQLFAYLEALEPNAVAVLAVDDEASAKLGRKAELASLLGCPAVLELGYRDSLGIVARKARWGGGAGAFAALAGAREHSRDGLSAVRVLGPVPREAEAME